MANLKEKAKKKAKSKTGSRLASKAKSRSTPPNMTGKTTSEIEREEKFASTPPLRDPATFDKAPPLPPTSIWLRKLATIPSLRKGGQSAT